MKLAGSMQLKALDFGCTHDDFILSASTTVINCVIPASIKSA